MPEKSTWPCSRSISIAFFWFQSKRMEVPQSLESWRGVGINLIACLALSNTASAFIADEFVSNRMTPNSFMAGSNFIKSGNDRADIIRRGENTGRQPDGTFRESSNGFMGRRGTVQTDPAQNPKLIIKPQANLRDRVARDGAGYDCGHFIRLTCTIYFYSIYILQSAK